ncbi:MAG: hypothetical protein Q9173_006803 [Seirophora scorigena]
MDVVTESATLEEEDVSSLPGVSDTNRDNLKQDDDEFQPHTWEDLIKIIGACQFQQLKRYPSQLRRYLIWSSQIRREYGNMSRFMRQERLQWYSPDDAEETAKPADPTPFGHPGHYRMLYNDWPYAVPPDVNHLVVWLKTPLASAPDGKLLPAARAQVQRFVNASFVSPIKARRGKDEEGPLVLWFKIGRRSSQ